MTNIYLIGSLSDLRVRLVGHVLRDEGYEVFNDWHASGPEADLIWQTYEEDRNRSFKDALIAPFSVHVRAFDMEHLNRADIGVLVSPPGKVGGFSAGIELTYLKWGRRKPTIVLLPPKLERWDQMTPIAADAVCETLPELSELLEQVRI